MTAQYPVWTGEGWINVPIPVMDGEALVVPNVAAIVYNEERSQILLQRRDKPGETVRGRLETPGGRWGAGEAAAQAIAREVLEETGVTVIAMISDGARFDYFPEMAIEATRPAAVINGLHGAYPALLVVYECIGAGSPRPQPGESAQPAWWDIEAVKDHLAADPEDFVWQAATVLRTVLA